MELKLRSLPVSGTKIDLIERLKAYQENSNIQAAAEKTAVTAAENAKSSPPVSPIASKVSSLGIEDASMADSPSKPSDTVSPAPCENSAHRSPQDECPTETSPQEEDSDKDKRLYEKERQIEELMRKLEREQRLVEELKMQLEVEKRSQQGDSPPHSGPLAAVQVKEENVTPPTCSASSGPPGPPGPPVMVKQEEAEDQCHASSQNRFVITHTDTLHKVEAGAHILLAASLPASAVANPLPAGSIKLHASVGSTVPGLVQTSGQGPQKIEASAALQQQCSIQPLTKVRKLSEDCTDCFTVSLFSSYSLVVL